MITNLVSFFLRCCTSPSISNVTVTSTPYSRVRSGYAGYYRLHRIESSSICDRCMKKSAHIYYPCGTHKMCDECASRFSSGAQCPLCRYRENRLQELFTGRCVITVDTYRPSKSIKKSEKKDVPFAPVPVRCIVMDPEPVYPLLDSPAFLQRYSIEREAKQPILSNGLCSVFSSFSL